MPPGDIYKYRVRISLLKQEELLPAEAGTKNKEVVFKNDQNPLNEIGESGKTKIAENTASFGFKRKQSSVRRRKDPVGLLMKGSPFTQRKEFREADDSIRKSEVKETWLDVDVEKHEEKDLLPGETYNVSLAFTQNTLTVLNKKNMNIIKYYKQVPGEPLINDLGHSRLLETSKPVLPDEAKPSWKPEGDRRGTWLLVGLLEPSTSSRPLLPCRLQS